MKKHYYLTKFDPNISKNKKTDPFERSTPQLMSAMIRDEKK